MNHSTKLPSLKITEIAFASALALAVTGLGCVSHKQTVYREVPRVRVEFENDTAGRLFYEALSKSREHATHNESKTEVHIPVVFDHERRVVEGESVAFNHAVRRCDTNNDGRITELEARIFSENCGK
jgi:hypothetical protein